MSTWSRRAWLGLSAGASASTILAQASSFAHEPLVTSPIPSTGERLPVIGLGSSTTFSHAAATKNVAALREVIATFVRQGGTVFDTAHSYGASEEIAGRIASEESLTDKIFWATKFNVAYGSGPANPAIAKAEIETSFRHLKKPKIDLIQIHNLGDVATQLRILKDLKARGRVRYIGVTCTLAQQHVHLIKIMHSEPLDFIGINYAIDDRGVEQTILPLARDRKIAVLVYEPFGQTRLFRRAGGRPLPAWAAEFDAKTWAQFFLKFVVSHPSVTAATPATSKAKNMLDNIGAGIGRLPDEATRKRMVAFVQTLPST
jgi:aryl-alcohol dehydrogenase-like predicted oxidoreductase